MFLLSSKKRKKKSKNYVKIPGKICYEKRENAKIKLRFKIFFKSFQN